MADGIQQATAQDVAALTDCIHAAYADYVAQGLDLPDLTSGLAQTVEDGYVWIIRDKGGIAAGMILFARAPEAYLENLFVHPAHGGRGLARQLVTQAEKTARAAGCTVIKLTTHAALPRLAALYEHMGWQVTRREGQKVAMERALPPV